MLPKININNKFEYIINHTGEKIVAQGYTVGQESTLLSAIQMADLDTLEGIKKVQVAIIQLCQECILSKNVNVRKWPNYELEFFLIQLRINSTGDKIESQFECDGIILDDKNEEHKCKETVKLEIDLNEFYIKEYKDFTNVFTLADGYSLHLKPILPLSINPKNGDDAIIKSCLDKLIVTTDEETIEYDFNDVEDSEINDFINNSISPKVMNNILKFFFNLSPSIFHSLSQTCEKCGKEHYIESTSVASLFQ
jgi:hypothetical protein